MLRYALAAIALFMFVIMAITLILSVLVIAAMALAVGVPLYLILKYHNRHQPRRLRRSPIEALQEMYAEGKIDLIEFERRVARLVAIEH
jgi:uncharacterized membrane protein